MGYSKEPGYALRSGETHTGVAPTPRYSDSKHRGIAGPWLLGGEVESGLERSTQSGGTSRVCAGTKSVSWSTGDVGRLCCLQRGGAGCCRACVCAGVRASRAVCNGSRLETH